MLVKTGQAARAVPAVVPTPAILTCVFVGPVGVEPTTRGLKVRCSAIELEARDIGT